MNRTLSLLKRELRTYFQSPIAYIVITVLLIGIGYFFFQTFFLSGQASLRAFFRFASWSYLIFAPAITMKLIAEEKKSGTIEHLLTLPVQEYQVVLGKFWAAWLVLATYLLITLAYPITISFIGDLDWGPVIGGYVGLLLLGAAYIAIGVFASAVSRNQVVSLIVAFILCLVLFVLQILLPFAPTSLQSTLAYLGTGSHFENVARGVLDTRDLVYYVTLAAAFLFLATQVIEARMSDRSARRRINKPVYMAAVLGTLVCVNILSMQAFARLDLTEDNRYTLSDATKDILGDLDDQLLVKCYFSKDLPAPFNDHARYLRDQLDEFKTYSDGHLRYEFVAPDKKTEGGEADPAAMRQAEQAGVPRIEVQKLEKDQVTMVKVFMGLVVYYHDRSEALPVVQSVDNLEYELTNRIAKLIRPDTPIVAFLSGHGEQSPNTTMQQFGQILSQNYEIGDVDLTNEDHNLSDADVLIVAGPREPVPAWQRFEIDQYIMNGGNAIFLVDRFDVNLQTFMGRPLETGIDDLTKAYGVDVKSEMVLDQLNQRIAMTQNRGGFQVRTLVDYPAFVRVRNLAEGHPLTKNMADLSLPFVARLQVDAPEGVAATEIAKSSEGTWPFEIDDTFLVDPQSLPRPLEGDLIGPQPLVVTLEGSFESAFAGETIPSREEGGPPVADALDERSPTTRLAVIGGSLFATDGMRNRLGLIFLSNLVDWMAQDERLIEIRSRGIDNRPIEELSEHARNAIKYGNMIGLPLAFVLIGLVFYRLRVNRKRRGYRPFGAAGKE